MKNISIFKIVSMIILLGLTIFFIFPFYWIATGSFKLQDVAITIPPEWWPTSPTLENYGKLFTPNTLRWFFNSVFISVMTTLLVCITSALAGYALAKKQFPGVKVIFMVFVAAMALPKQVILIPLLNLITEFGLMNTYYALILPAVGWPFGVFLMRQFSQAIPTELLESARIDGAGFWVMLKNITLPLLKPTMIFVSLPIIKPGIGALAIFTFIASWNDYFSQLIFSNTPDMSTLPLGLAALAQGQEFSNDYGLLMAGASLASLPMIIVFICFQNYFTQGVTLGAVKG